MKYKDTKKEADAYIEMFKPYVDGMGDVKTANATLCAIKCLERVVTENKNCQKLMDDTFSKAVADKRVDMLFEIIQELRYRLV